MFAARGMHVAVLGQQKFDGSPVALHGMSIVTGQLDARSKRSFKDRAVAEVPSTISTKCLAIRTRAISQKIRRMCYCGLGLENHVV